MSVVASGSLREDPRILLQGDMVHTNDGCIQETPEYLKPFAEWAEGMRRPPKRQKRVPMMSRDAFEGRPLSLKQRLRTGSVPVVEANPNLSIDDTGTHSFAVLSPHVPGGTSFARCYASAFLGIPSRALKHILSAVAALHTSAC